MVKWDLSFGCKETWKWNKLCQQGKEPNHAVISGDTEKALNEVTPFTNTQNSHKLEIKGTLSQYSQIHTCWIHSLQDTELWKAELMTVSVYIQHIFKIALEVISRAVSQGRLTKRAQMIPDSKWHDLVYKKPTGTTKKIC